MEARLLYVSILLMLSLSSSAFECLADMPHHEQDGRNVIKLEEGKESEYFWHLLDSTDMEYASANVSLLLLGALVHFSMLTHSLSPLTALALSSTRSNLRFPSRYLTRVKSIDHSQRRSFTFCVQHLPPGRWIRVRCPRAFSVTIEQAWDCSRVGDGARIGKRMEGSTIALHADLPCSLLPLSHSEGSLICI